MSLWAQFRERGHPIVNSGNKISSFKISCELKYLILLKPDSIVVSNSLKQRIILTYGASFADSTEFETTTERRLNQA